MGETTNQFSDLNNLQGTMNFSEQDAILPSRIIDDSKNFSSPFFATIYSVVGKSISSSQFPHIR